MRRDSELKTDFIFLIIILILAAFLCVIFFTRVTKTENSNSSNGIEWNGEQQIDKFQETEYIAIPGISELYFAKDQIEQKVNLFNPAENNCSMNFSIVMDDGYLLWNEQNIQPGYGIYDITLNKELSRGVYSGTVVVECFSIDGHAELNGCTFECQIVVR